MQDRGFEVRGLPGYRVVCDAGWFWTMVTGVATFSWNDETMKHDVPDYRKAYGIARRSTAKGAVAAAHEHAQWVQREMAKRAA